MDGLGERHRSTCAAGRRRRSTTTLKRRRAVPMPTCSALSMGSSSRLALRWRVDSEDDMVRLIDWIQRVVTFGWRRLGTASQLINSVSRSRGTNTD
jgi:hypothetical protein